MVVRHQGKTNGVISQDIIVKIAGLEAVAGEPGTFKLEGVKPVEVEWGSVANTLEEAGIPRSRAMHYTDSMAEEVYKSELARAIAERMERIG